MSNRVPHFNMLKENTPRDGFVNDEQYGALVEACNEVGAWLRALFEVAYTFGWRVSELLSLQVRQVDLSAGTIRLDAGTTKNGEARFATMTSTVRALMAALVSGKDPEERVFTREGTPIADFRGVWEKVTTAASVPGLLFHDLRRTAVRNMVRAGIPERVAMTISGHKTRSVFERYNIVCERDLKDAAAKMESRLVANRLQGPQPPAREESAETRKLLN
jgi:integrase